MYSRFRPSIGKACHGLLEAGAPGCANLRDTMRKNPLAPGARGHLARMEWLPGSARSNPRCLAAKNSLLGQSRECGAMAGSPATERVRESPRKRFACVALSTGTSGLGITVIRDSRYKDREPQARSKDTHALPY